MCFFSYISFACLHFYTIDHLIVNLTTLCCTSLQNGYTAVHLAACGGHLSVVTELVDIHHANVHQKTQVLGRLNPLTAVYMIHSVWPAYMR